MVRGLSGGIFYNSLYVCQSVCVYFWRSKNVLVPNFPHIFPISSTRLCNNAPLFLSENGMHDFHLNEITSEKNASFVFSPNAKHNVFLCMRSLFPVSISHWGRDLTRKNNNNARISRFIKFVILLIVCALIVSHSVHCFHAKSYPLSRLTHSCSQFSMMTLKCVPTSDFYLSIIWRCRNSDTTLRVHNTNPMQ